MKIFPPFSCLQPRKIKATENKNSAIEYLLAFFHQEKIKAMKNKTEQKREMPSFFLFHWANAIQNKNRMKKSASFKNTTNESLPSFPFTTQKTIAN